MSKGQQLTIPARFRKALHLREGSRVDIQKKNDAIIIRSIGVDIEQLFKQAKGVSPKHNLSAKKMDELIEHEIH